MLALSIAHTPPGTIYRAASRTESKKMRPSDISDQDIIQAGISIAQAGGTVSGSRIKTLLGYGNVARFKRIWDAHIADQEEAASRLAVLPHEVLREVETIKDSLMAEISRLAHRLNDLAVKDAQQQVVRGIDSARMHKEAFQQELDEAAKIIDDAEAQLFSTRSECEAQAKLLAETQVRSRSLATENVRLKERLKASRAAGARVESHKGNANAARAEAASIAGRLEEAQAVNKQLIASRV